MENAGTPVEALMGKKLVAVVTLNEFSAFLEAGRRNGACDDAGFVNIGGILADLVRAYNDDRLVILTKEEKADAMRRAACQAVTDVAGRAFA